MLFIELTDIFTYHEALRMTWEGVLEKNKWLLNKTKEVKNHD